MLSGSAGSLLNLPFNTAYFKNSDQAIWALVYDRYFDAQLLGLCGRDICFGYLYILKNERTHPYHMSMAILDTRDSLVYCLHSPHLYLELVEVAEDCKFLEELNREIGDTIRRMP